MDLKYDVLNDWTADQSLPSIVFIGPSRTSYAYDHPSVKFYLSEDALPQLSNDDVEDLGNIARLVLISFVTLSLKKLRSEILYNLANISDQEQIKRYLNFILSELETAKQDVEDTFGSDEVLSSGYFSIIDGKIHASKKRTETDTITRLFTLYLSVRNRYIKAINTVSSMLRSPIESSQDSITPLTVETSDPKTLKDLFKDLKKYDHVINGLVKHGCIVRSADKLTLIPTRKNAKYEVEALRQALSWKDFLKYDPLTNSEILNILSNTFMNFTASERTLRSKSIPDSVKHYMEVLSGI